MDKVVRHGTAGNCGGGGLLAFEHVLDEDAALSNFLVNNELLIV